MKKNYMPGSMGFAEGILYHPIGGDTFMLVDEERAISIIKEQLAQGKKISHAELGLDGDWRENSTEVYDGEFHPYDSYEGSLWATPTLIIFYEDDASEAYECWNPETKEVK